MSGKRIFNKILSSILITAMFLANAAIVPSSCVYAYNYSDFDLDANDVRTFDFDEIQPPTPTPQNSNEKTTNAKTEKETQNKNEDVYDFSDEAQAKFDGVTSSPKSVHNEIGTPSSTVWHPAKDSPAPLKGSIVHVKEGASFQAVLQSTISSASLTNNDTIAALLQDDWVSNNTVIAPAGCIVYAKAVDVKSSGGFFKNGQISITFHELMLPNGEKLTLTSNVVTVKNSGKRGWKVAGAVVGGALAGAAVAAVSAVSGNLSGVAVAIGAGIGAITGATGAAVSKGEDVEIPSNTVINVRLTQPMTANPYVEEE